MINVLFTITNTAEAIRNGNLLKSAFIERDKSFGPKFQMERDALFILGISPGRNSPRKCRIPSAQKKKKGRRRKEKEKNPWELFIPPGCEESRI